MISFSHNKNEKKKKITNKQKNKRSGDTKVIVVKHDLYTKYVENINIKRLLIHNLNQPTNQPTNEQTNRHIVEDALISYYFFYISTSGPLDSIELNIGSSFKHQKANSRARKREDKGMRDEKGKRKNGKIVENKKKRFFWVWTLALCESGDEKKGNLLICILGFSPTNNLSLYRAESVGNDKLTLKNLIHIHFQRKDEK